MSIMDSAELGGTSHGPRTSFGAALLRKFRRVMVNVCSINAMTITRVMIFTARLQIIGRSSSRVVLEGAEPFQGKWADVAYSSPDPLMSSSPVKVWCDGLRYVTPCASDAGA
jgi:hypothetical protein